jgi:hypothetical protein
LAALASKFSVTPTATTAMTSPATIAMISRSMALHLRRLAGQEQNRLFLTSNLDEL